MLHAHCLGSELLISNSLGKQRLQRIWDKSCGRLTYLIKPGQVSTLTLREQMAQHKNSLHSPNLATTTVHVTPKKGSFSDSSYTYIGAKMPSIYIRIPTTRQGNPQKRGKPAQNCTHIWRCPPSTQMASTLPIKDNPPSSKPISSGQRINRSNAADASIGVV